jgi:hypothetical protein
MLSTLKVGLQLPQVDPSTGAELLKALLAELLAETFRVPLEEAARSCQLIQPEADVVQKNAFAPLRCIHFLEVEEAG